MKRRDARVAELEAALERARAASEALRRVGTAVAQRPQDELLETIVDATAEVLGAERVTLYLREGDTLVSHVKIGDEIERITVPIGRGIAGHAAKTGTVVRVANAERDARFDPTWDAQSGYHTRSIVAAPISADGGDSIGVLQALNKRGPTGPAAFTRYDAALLEALAAQAAVAIDKARLFDRMRGTTERLERTLAHLELMYRLETSMSAAETVGELAVKVVALVAPACGAVAGALLHKSEGRAAVYAVDRRAPDELRQAILEHEGGAAALLGMEGGPSASAPLGSDNGATRGEEEPAGALMFFRERGAPAFNDEERSLIKLVSANVATELRVIDSRQRRERAGRLETIGRLLSGVMHDLRTPLAVISGYVQMMEASDDRGKRAEWGRVVSGQFEAIGAMQRDLLAYARGESALYRRRVDLGQFLDELRGQFTTDAEVLGVTLTVEHDASHAWFDEGKIVRALQNLVRNALEAMQKEGGALTLTGRSEDGMTTIEISDTGGGIPAPVRTRLFEPFVTAGKRHGTGLGLANVKKLVDEHDGTVQVRSSARGTRFIIVLPHKSR